MAFTLITNPEQLEPSTSITNSYTLNTQVQPIAGTIRSQIFGLRRPESSKKLTLSDPAAAWGVNAGDTQSLWISSNINSLENTFSRTAFYGATQNVLAGYDFTRTDKYVLGISGGYEASNFTTKFNSGNEKTGGYNLNPYFAWLISNAWSLDLIGGYGRFDTNQSRTIGGAAPPAVVTVDSEFKSTRAFASTNLTNISAFGNWKLTGSLGYLWTRRSSDGYTESDGTTTVDASKQTSKQWNLLGELAYGAGSSETFFGARYEDIRNYQKLELTPGDQPANDPTSFVLSAGWRYFGKGLTASFVFTGRVGQEQVKEHGFSMVIRADI